MKKNHMKWKIKIIVTNKIIIKVILFHAFHVLFKIQLELQGVSLIFVNWYQARVYLEIGSGYQNIFHIC